MKIKKKELFRYLEELTGDYCYIGLHGISDDPDIKNDYFNLSKEEKAENILKSGLFNERKLSIKSTCFIFGNLTDTYENNKNSVLRLNALKPYKSTGNNCVVIVSVPILFEHSDGSKIFGGWMNPNKSYSDDDSPFECITDLLFYDVIPKEMILGYYSFNDGDEDIDLVFNDNYYYKLDQDKRDEFIYDYFYKNDFVIDLNKLSQFDWLTYLKTSFGEFIKKNKLNIKKYSINDFFSEMEKYFLSNFLPQLEEYILVQDERKNTKKERNNSVSFYTFSELESLPIEKIDIERIKPDFNMLINSKYAIRDLFINKSYGNHFSLASDVGYYIYNSVNESVFVKIEDFESWVKKCGNVPNNLYDIHYQRFYKELESDFINKIKKMKMEKSYN